MPTTIRDIISQATAQLEGAGIPSARLDAEVLLAFCLNCNRLDLMKNPERLLDDDERISFCAFIARRLRHEPVAYITGRKDFWSFTLEVNNNVLIPRPDTEVIVEEVLAVLNAQPVDQPRILDIGTGSGAIALALAAEIPGVQVTATDISEAALAVAKKNALALGLGHSITFLQGDLFAPVRGTFNLIVSNPPYISAGEYETLPAGVKDFEPRVALFAGKSGLEFYKNLVYQAKDYLKEKGWLLLEIGDKQSREVRNLMEITEFYDSIDVRTDYAGLSRVIKGRRK